MGEELNNFIERKINIGLLSINGKWNLGVDEIKEIDGIFCAKKIKGFKTTIVKSTTNESEQYNLSALIDKIDNKFYSEVLKEYNIVILKDDSHLQEIINDEEGTITKFFSPQTAGKEKKRRIFQRHKIIFFKHPDFFNQTTETKQYFGIVLSESTQSISYNFGALNNFLNDYISENQNIGINTHIGIDKVINHDSLKKLYNGDIQGIDINLISNNWQSYNSLNSTLGLTNYDEEEEYTNTPTNNKEMCETSSSEVELKMKFMFESKDNKAFYKKLGTFFSGIKENLVRRKKDSSGMESALYGNIRFKDGNSWYSLFDLALNFIFSCKIIDDNYPRLIVANTDTKYFFDNITNIFLNKFGLLKGKKIEIKKLFTMLNTFKDEEKNTII